VIQAVAIISTVVALLAIGFALYLTRRPRAPWWYEESNDSEE
jgi:hypothetical protein